MRELSAIRAAIALKKADGNPFAAQALTEHNDPIVSKYLHKSAVSGSTLSDYLVLAGETVAQELGKYIFSQSVAGQLMADSLNLPFGSQIASISGIGADWLKEGEGIALQRGNAPGEKLEPYKLASLTAVSNELLTFSSQGTEIAVRDVLTSAAVKAIDKKFLSDDEKVKEVSPQGILFGAETAADMTELLGKHEDNNNDLSKSGLILPVGEVLKLTESQFKQFELLGVKLIASQRTDKIILVDASKLVIKVEGTLIDLADKGAIEMTDSPTADIATPAGAEMVSLFQTNTTVFRAITYCSWAVMGKAVTVLNSKA